MIEARAQYEHLVSRLGPNGSYWTRGFDGSWDYGLRDFSLKASLST
jgi:hypothetical protein